MYATNPASVSNSSTITSPNRTSPWSTCSMPRRCSRSPVISSVGISPSPTGEGLHQEAAHAVRHRLAQRLQMDGRRAVPASELLACRTWFIRDVELGQGNFTVVPGTHKPMDCPMTGCPSMIHGPYRRQGKDCLVNNPNSGTVIANDSDRERYMITITYKHADEALNNELPTTDEWFERQTTRCASNSAIAT